MSRRALALLLVLTPLALPACMPGQPLCVAAPGQPDPGVILGGQVRLPAAVADANAKENFSREVAVSKGEVYLADAAGRALPGVSAYTSLTGTYAMQRVPAGQSWVVAVRAKTASGKGVVLRGLAQTGPQGATAEVNAATTIATLALTEGLRGAVGAYDQGSYDKLVAKVYEKLAGVTALDLGDEKAVIAMFASWAAADPAMKALFDRLRGELASPKITIEEQIRALELAQGIPSTRNLPARPSATPIGALTPPPAGATPAPTGAPTEAPTAAPADATPTPGTPPPAPPSGAATVTTVTGSGSGFKDGTLAEALFSTPGGLAFDQNAVPPVLYVADTGNNRVRRIDFVDSGPVSVRTIAGTGNPGGRNGNGDAAEFDRPVGLAFDTKGLLVVESGGRRVRRIDVSSGAFRVSTVAEPTGDGALGVPYGIAVNPGSGVVYVTDTGNSTVRMLPKDSDGTVPATFVGAKGVAEDGALLNPLGLAYDPGNFLWCADAGKGLIRTISSNGTVATFAGKYEPPVPGGGSAPAYAEGIGPEARFNRPAGLARHTQGWLVIADSGNNRIRRMDVSGQTTLVAGSGAAGTTDGAGEFAAFNNPSWVAVGIDGEIWVSDQGNHRIRRIDF